MKGRGKFLSVLVGAMMVLGVGEARATLITFDFSALSGDLGASALISDTSSLYTVPIAAFNGAGYYGCCGSNWGLPAGGINTAHLVGSSGLGVSSSSSFSPINVGDIIQLDLLNLITSNETKNLSLSGGNVAVFGSNTAVANGGTGTYLGACNTATCVLNFATIDYRYQWITVTPNSATAKLGSVSGEATAVPEPGTLSLLGAGLVGLGFMRRKRGA